jgi:hypothetical protein
MCEKVYKLENEEENVLHMAIRMADVLADLDRLELILSQPEDHTENRVFFEECYCTGISVLDTIGTTSEYHKRVSWFDAYFLSQLCIDAYDDPRWQPIPKSQRPQRPQKQHKQQLPYDTQ